MGLSNRPPRPGSNDIQPDDDQPLVDPGRPLGLRLLALLGAFSFLMLGLASVVIPLLQPRPQPPTPTPPQAPAANQAA